MVGIIGGVQLLGDLPELKTPLFGHVKLLSCSTLLNSTRTYFDGLLRNRSQPCYWVGCVPSLGLSDQFMYILSENMCAAPLVRRYFLCAALTRPRWHFLSHGAWQQSVYVFCLHANLGGVFIAELTLAIVLFRSFGGRGATRAPVSHAAWHLV